MRRCRICQRRGLRRVAPNVNKLFVFGGDEPNTGTVVNTTRIYDIATNTWSTRSADA